MWFFLLCRTYVFRFLWIADCEIHNLSVYKRRTFINTCLHLVLLFSKHLRPCKEFSINANSKDLAVAFRMTLCLFPLCSRWVYASNPLCINEERRLNAGNGVERLVHWDVIRLCITPLGVLIPNLFKSTFVATGLWELALRATWELISWRPDVRKCKLISPTIPVTNPQRITFCDVQPNSRNPSPIFWYKQEQEVAIVYVYPLGGRWQYYLWRMNSNQMFEEATRLLNQRNSLWLPPLLLPDGRE